jgi:hypothetical protein
MEKQNLTPQDLKIGSVISYQDSHNPYQEAVVLGIEETEYGTEVKFIWLETETISFLHGPRYQIGWQFPENVYRV